MFNLSSRHSGFPLGISSVSLQTTTKGWAIVYMPTNYNQFVEKGLRYSILAFIRGIK